MKKRILNVFLVVSIISSFLVILLVAANAENTINGTCGDNLTWTLDDAGTLTIRGTGDMADWRNHNYVPWRSKKNDIKSVIIENGVTDIGDSAFHECYYLESVIIPDSVTEVESGAFYSCHSLTSVIIPDGVTSVGSLVFHDCYSLTSVIIPDSLTYIGANMFSYCESLTSITIPDTVTSIRAEAFFNCEKLENITIPDSVASIGHKAFYGTGYYNDISNWENDVLYMGKYLVDTKESINGEYNIKQGTVIIADRTFYNYDNLTSIIIPNSVASIGYMTFYSCGKLENITIPDSVASIGTQAFFNCTNLSNITIGNGITSIDMEAFHGTGYYNNITNWENDVLYIGKYLIDVKESINGEYNIKHPFQHPILPYLCRLIIDIPQQKKGYSWNIH